MKSLAYEMGCLFREAELDVGRYHHLKNPEVFLEARLKVLEPSTFDLEVKCNVKTFAIGFQSNANSIPSYTCGPMYTGSSHDIKDCENLK